METSLYKKFLFHLQRTIKNKSLRDLVTATMAKRIGKKGVFIGKSLLSKEAISTTPAALAKDGFVKFGKILSDEEIDALLNYSKTTRCFNPYDASAGFFTFDTIPADCHVANYKREDLVKNELILKIANDPGVLSIAQEFLGATPTISNVNMWWSMPGRSEAKHAQLFHRDVDDLKFCKLFIYLTDVTENEGPHVYVKGSANSPKLRKIGRYSDEQIANTFGKENILNVCAPRGHAFMVDTYGFHKGLLPKSGLRLLFQVQYSLHGIGIENYIPQPNTNAVQIDPYVNRLIVS